MQSKQTRCASIAARLHGAACATVGHSTVPFTTGILLLTPVIGSTQALFNNGILLPQANSSWSSLIQDLTSSSVGLT